MTSYPAGGMTPNHPHNSEFYSHSQAKILAETYYNLGYNLYESILPLLPVPNCKTEDSWKLWPAFINISFSCEIILKLFYENDNGKMAHGHKLYEHLFKELSVASQKIISDITINFMTANGSENYTYTTFIDDLIKSENTFAYERYVFEMVPGRSHGLQCGFLLSFARALNALAKGLV
ncbi:MAG: hypothetical protein PHC41_10315 [Lachnospiraceae bacterium]|nr:hypothetical protein [Lachnospiraceae bacterium]MDD3616603.1 hypothetical protein [Lachnospiraceae bacterium]